MARIRATSPVASAGRVKPVHSAASSVEPPAPQADIPGHGAADLAAMAQANAALIEGFGAIGAVVYAYIRDSLGSAARTARSMIDARSLLDVVALNHDFAQAALEGLIANSARVAEIGVRTTSEALKPLGERVAETMSKLSHPTKV